MYLPSVESNSTWNIKSTKFAFENEECDWTKQLNTRNEQTLISSRYATYPDTESKIEYFVADVVFSRIGINNDRIIKVGANLWVSIWIQTGVTKR